MAGNDEDVGCWMLDISIARKTMRGKVEPRDGRKGKNGTDAVNGFV